MSAGTRERILDAAARLLVTEGQEGLSTRAVAAAAGVQGPTLYRLFGDKQGLVDAVVAHGFERYLADKHALAPTGDVRRDLRQGWDLHVQFGLTHPAFYALMFGNPRREHQSPAAAETSRLLMVTLDRVARAGLLKVTPADAARMTHAAVVGVTLTLIADPGQPGAQELSRMVREAVLAAVLVDTGDEEPGEPVLATHAIALAAALTGDGATGRTPDSAAEVLTPAETGLLLQWLRRLAGSS
jgi:AcrR family transcriptional regulator